MMDDSGKNFEKWRYSRVLSWDYENIKTVAKVEREKFEI